MVPWRPTCKAGGPGFRGREDPNTIIGTDQRLVGQTFMALNGIDLTVYKGEALGIIGGNGAGKSTLLYLSRYPEATAVNIENHRKRALAYFTSGGALFCSPVTWLEVAELLLPPGFFLKRKTAPEPVEGVLFP